MSRDDFIYQAKMAEQAERFDDMVEAVKQATRMSDEEFTGEERNLFSLAYKNAIGARRQSWRMVSTIEQVKANSSEGGNHGDVIKNYRMVIEKEVLAVSDEVIQLIETFILPKVALPEQKVFWLKMKADYHRYTAEVATEEKLSQAIESAKQTYQDALKIAEENMRVINPIRLGLVLNLSVFYYEILKEFDSACDLAKEAFDAGISQLDTPGEESYKDSTLILQLLRDNLALWTAKASIDANSKNKSP